MMLIQKEWVERMSPGMLASHYLMASYLYYLRNEGPMTDEAFDRCCQLLDERWDEVKHPHRRLIDRRALSATTGYNIRWDRCPKILQIAAFTLLESVHAGTIYDELLPSLVSPHRRTRYVPVQVEANRPVRNSHLLRRRASQPIGASAEDGAERRGSESRMALDTGERSSSSVLRRRRGVGVAQAERSASPTVDHHENPSQDDSGGGSDGPTRVVRRSRPGATRQPESVPPSTDLFPPEDERPTRLVRRVGRTR